MNRMMIVYGLLALLVGGCMAHPTGAPSRTCDDPFMEPTYHRDHLNATGYNNTNQYNLTRASVEGSPKLIQVTLSGARFKGFVVRASTPEGETNLGQFNASEQSVPFHNLNCTNPKDVAVTQSDPSYKPSVVLLFEDKSNGTTYTFQATVVPDITTYVINIFEN